MDKLEYRAVIRFLVLEGVTPSEIQTRMVKVYGDLAPSCSTIKKWAAEFKKGRTSLKDDPREGRPKCATGSNIIQKVSNLVLQDRRLKVREIADDIEVSTGSAFEILTKKLNMRKLFGRWVPAVLTDEEKVNRKKAAESCLEIFGNENCNLTENFITLGETWIHIYEHPQQQTKHDGPPIKMKKASASNDKILALIFWDSEGVLHSSYIDRNQVINTEFILPLLEDFDSALCEKRPNRLKKLNYFYPDINQIYDDPIILNKLTEMNYILVKQPLLSPDLSPSDYHLFPKLENFLQAKRPTSIDEAIDAVEHYLRDLPQNNYRAGMEYFAKRCMDCNNLDGNYIEPNAMNKSYAAVTETILG